MGDQNRRQESTHTRRCGGGGRCRGGVLGLRSSTADRGGPFLRTIVLAHRDQLCHAGVGKCRWHVGNGRRTTLPATDSPPSASSPSGGHMGGHLSSDTLLLHCDTTRGTKLGKSSPKISKSSSIVTKCDKDYTSRKNCIKDVFPVNRAGESQITFPKITMPAPAEEVNRNHYPHFA